MKTFSLSMILIGCSFTVIGGGMLVAPAPAAPTPAPALATPAASPATKPALLPPVDQTNLDPGKQVRINFPFTRIPGLSMQQKEQLIAVRWQIAQEIAQLRVKEREMSLLWLTPEQLVEAKRLIAEAEAKETLRDNRRAAATPTTKPTATPTDDGQ